MVPRARVELARPKAKDFKSFVSTIPPPRPYMEATGGFEPPNRGFADLGLRPLGYVAMKNLF